MILSRLALHALLGLVATLALSQKGVLYVSAQEEAAAATEAAAPPAPPADAETFTFDAQVDKMLHIVVNSLYKDPSVAIRELISNGSDALDKIRYLLLSEPEQYKASDDVELKMEIEYDTDKKTLTIRDTGVGMTREDMIANLGTVARSGTTKFVEALKDSGNADATMSQIGQFGVGFYSAFLVADKVSVASKSPTDPVQHVWESNNGASDFIVYPDPRGNSLQRGTEITLHLKEDSLEYTDPNRLRGLAQHYSEFVIYPISLRTTHTIEVEDDEDEEIIKDETTKSDEDLEVTEEDEPAEKPKKMKQLTSYEWERLNTNQAIWTRDKDEITDDEYQSFFHVLSGSEHSNASTWVHFNAEGNINFKSILYLPEDVPSSYRYGNIDSVTGAMRLYVRKVLIGDDFDVMPKYLGFIRGIIDSEDLPLNVNRETLQETKVLQVIKKKVVRKAIDLISQFARESEEEAEQAKGEKDEEGNEVVPKNKYTEWYKKFSPNIKLGMIDDEPNRGKLAKLVRYPTSKSNGELISLGQYVENMKDWQKEIYVIGGSSIEEIEKSPFIETFREKDVEVIYMTDALDEYLVQNVRDFNGKKFVQATSESVKFKDEDEDLAKRREKVYKKKYAPLTKWLKKLYGNTVLRVQVAKRGLGSVPAIVSSSEYGNSANMERIMRAQAFQHGVDPSGMMSMRVFEINPRHPIITKLLDGCPPENDKEGEDSFSVSQETVDAAMMIHDMAMLSGGFPITDIKGHNRRLAKILKEKMRLDSLKLEPEIDPPVEEEEAPEVEDLDGGFNMEDFAQFGDAAKFMNAEDLQNMDFNMDDLMQDKDEL